MAKNILIVDKKRLYFAFGCIIFASLMFSMGVNALYIDASHNVNLTQIGDPSAAAQFGVKIQVQQKDVYFKGMTKDSASTFTKFYLRTSMNGVNLTTGTFVGNNATIATNYTLSANQYYYIVFDAAGSAYRERQINSSASYPYNNSYISFVAGANGASGTDSSSQIFGVKSIILQSDFENSQSFQPVTIEGTYENFTINITYDSTTYPNIAASLVYNNSKYNGVKIGSGDNVIYSSSVSIPGVAVSSNISFYWEFNFINTTGTAKYLNSTWQQQNVNNLNIGDCSSYQFTVLNYTMRDERTQAIINANQTNATIEIDLQIYPYSSNSITLNLSTIVNKKNNTQICLENSLLNTSLYRMYVQTRYYADGYVPRFNYIQNFTITNATIPQNINLFNLVNSSTQFFITYKDANFVPVDSALISISRKYISEGVFKTVDVEQTDAYGQATAYFDLAGAVYSISITKQGELLRNYDSITLFCQDTVTKNCPLNLNAVSTTNPTINFYKYNNITYSLDFNLTTKKVTAIFNTIDGSTAFFQLNVTKFDNYMNTSICSNYVITSSGTLFCTVPDSFGNTTVYVTFYKDSSIVVSNIISIMTSKAKDIFKGNIVVLSLVLIITLPIMLIPSATFVIIGGIIGVGISFVLLALSGSIIGIGSSLIWIIVAAIIIIWRIEHKGSD